MRMEFARIGSVAAAALALPLLLGAGSCPHKPNPIVFVHGGSGSGAQFESQAMRFESNGYPQGHIGVLEYDSSVPLVTNPANLAAVHAKLDALIAELQAGTGAAQVDLMGHSLGTFVSQTYLSTPARAANVAHYVNIDGGAASAPPGGVPTLALWAGAVTRPVPPEITGATNVTIPNQEHVQVATSEESFAEMFRFLQGREPFTRKILPQIRPSISGRVTAFPQNTGLGGATLEVWLVDGDTGERVFDHPQETFAIDPDGSFGPFQAWFGLHYEFAVLREGEVTINYFYEPFLRSDDLVRLNVALGLAPFIPQSDASTTLTVVRFKEFWGNRGADNDVLAIDGTDVVNATSSPCCAVGAASVSFFLFDAGLDGVSHVPGPIPFPFGPLAFLTSQDLFIPTDPPGTVTVETVPRGNLDEARTVHVPNLPSTTNRVVVQLYDFEQ